VKTTGNHFWWKGRQRKYGVYLHTSSTPHSCEKGRFVLMWGKNRGSGLEEIVSLFNIVFASVDRSIHCLSDCSVSIFYFSFCLVKCFISFCCAFHSCPCSNEGGEVYNPVYNKIRKSEHQGFVKLLDSGGSFQIGHSLYKADMKALNPDVPTNFGNVARKLISLRAKIFFFLS
jgi:hypothetical protein